MNFERFIEHTALSPTLTAEDVDKLVREAIQFQFHGVCVPPFWVKRARREAGEAPLVVVTVAGFPLGYNLTETKVDEINRVIDHGAQEVDMVMNLSAFKSGIPWTKIEIAKCASICHARQIILKVIIETAQLSEVEIQQASKLCADAGADFVKTSTGFGPGGATVEHVKLIRAAVHPSVGIKASGGIKTREQALRLIDAGANRIGTSSAVSMMQSNS
ncbi:MAG: deoxyribose-phosphate aldolase [Cytophagales bacterium]|nr:deoxyribose-phosphate aldolase [Cytophagales bacterium]